MPRKYTPINCCKSDIEILQSASKECDKRIAQRARMVLLCVEGKTITDIAKELDERPNTVSFWKDRYVKYGIKGLLNNPRGKQKLENVENLQDQILEILQKEPSYGKPHWTGPLIAEALSIPSDTIWRYLRKMQIQPRHLEKSICRTYNLPIQLTTISNMVNKENMMDLEMTVKLTSKDGTIIEKTIKVNDCVPDAKDIDLCTKEGFLSDYDVYERIMLKTRDELSTEITKQYLCDASKSKKKPGK